MSTSAIIQVLLRNLPNVPPLIGEKSHSKRKTRDAVIQAMIEVDTEEWDEFLLA